jgi:hypothetical protein
MSASKRLQEQKDVALASVKETLEKSGKILPTQAELNIGNKVGDLTSLVDSSIGNVLGSITGGLGSLVGGITGGLGDLTSGLGDLTGGLTSGLSGIADSVTGAFDNLVNDTINSVTGQLDGLFGGIQDAIGQLSAAFEQTTGALTSKVDETKTEVLERKPDYTAPSTGSYVDDDGITTYTDKDVMDADIKSKKIPENTVVKLEKDNTYYTPVFDRKGSVEPSTLYNANCKKKAAGEELVLPPNAETKSVINGVPNVVSKAPIPPKSERKEFPTTIDPNTASSNTTLHNKKMELKRLNAEYFGEDTKIKQRLIDANAGVTPDYILEDDPAYISWETSYNAKITKLEKEIAELEASGAAEQTDAVDEALNDTSELDAALANDAEFQRLSEASDPDFDAALETGKLPTKTSLNSDQLNRTTTTTSTSSSTETVTGGGVTIIEAEKRTPAQEAALQEELKQKAIDRAKSTEYTREKRALSAARRIKTKYGVTLKAYKDGKRWRLS